MSDEPRRLYERFLLEMWNDDGGESVASQVVTPGFTIHQAGQPDDVRGPAALVRLIEQGRAPFDDVRVAIVVGPLVDRDLVAARWSFAGRYRGGIPGTTAEAGTQVEFGGNDLLRVEGGLFAEYWVSSDGLHLMAQLSPG